MKERNEWFFRGRVVRGLPTAELRRRAYQAKLQLRAQRALALPQAGPQISFSAGSWSPLGPVPLASDASGNGTQDYHQVAGRATAVVIDPADPSGNTVYIGGAQSGIWKSTDAANPVANDVTWTPITDNQATLSIGAIAIQPGSNNEPSKSLILAATGEANSSGDSYFGLGMLRSADGGSTWSLISTANGGALSFSGLGGTRMAFSTVSGQTNTVVAAMAASSEGVVDGAITNSTKRGLYTSRDGGQSWGYDALTDPGGPTDATSATSVVYNDGAQQFFAAVRYHGFYSSSDGVNWSRLAAQPGGAVLSAAACPPLSTSNSYGCPIYRGEIATVPGRNEMYVWYVYFSPAGYLVDGGIWQSFDGGASWNSISNNGITNCGDGYGCGVEQGSYNLELLAMPDGGATDLYAGAINLYKCQINVQNPACAAQPFINLTHVYGCNPIAAPSHVHPDQHALAAIIPSSGNALLYFANDGGVYRTLNGYTGLTTGSCSGTNQFDDLNQNLGSMAQFVSFSQHPTDPNTILGGTQDNGSPATNQATTSLSWANVLGGDGGYNAIDPIAGTNFYASNPDVPPQGLGVQLCTSGVYCNNSLFNSVVTSSGLDGDDGAFYFPYILDPGSSTAMLIGTCRVWRGPRAGGVFTALSPNFDTFGSATCTGSEVNQVRGLAAAGTIDSNGSGTIYATTSGLGPLQGAYSPAGGRVWVTTSASAGPPAFLDVTGNGPQGNINPNQYPISGVAIDPSDVSGNTAYLTVMGFTGGPGHVWKTNNAGASWVDFTGNLPDSPANAVVVYAPMSQVFVATDAGVFASPTSAPNWTELGPVPSSNQAGFLPNVAVTALGIFNQPSQQLLRASTYGRGIWQFNLSTAPDFQILIATPSQTVQPGQNATFNGTVSALNGYSSSVTLSCTKGITNPPATCTLSPSSLTPGMRTPFTLTAGGAAGGYSFNVQGVGSDSKAKTHSVPIVLNVCGQSDFCLGGPGAPSILNSGGTGSLSQVVNVTGNGFQGTVAMSCSVYLPNGNPANVSCSANPATVTSLPSQVSVTVDATNLIASGMNDPPYYVVVQGTSGITHIAQLPFYVADYQLSGPQNLTVGGGGQGTVNFTVTASPYYSGMLDVSCDVASKVPGASCSFNANPLVVRLGAMTTLTVTVSVPSGAASGTYGVNLNTRDHSSGVPAHNGTLSLTVTQDFSLTRVTTSETVNPGGTTQPYNLTVAPIQGSFTGSVAFSCTGLPPGAQCVFSPSTVTPGNSSATVAMAISTIIPTPANTPGGYPVTVVATSGSLSHSVPVSLVVSDFFLPTVTQDLNSRGPVDAGATATALVTFTPNYNGSITVGCNFLSSLSSQPCSITSGSTSGRTFPISTNNPVQLAISLNVSGTAPGGPYTVNVPITDSSGQPSYTVNLTLTVQDFSITTSTLSQTINAGQTAGPYQLTVAPNPAGSSFAGAVTLACQGLPSGANCLFNPSTPVIPGASQMVALTISTPSSVGAGPYTVTVSATSGPDSHSVTVSLVVSNFAVTPTPASQTQTVNAGQTTGPYTLTVAPVPANASFSAPVTLSCTQGLPAGAQCAFSPSATVTPSTSQTVTMTVSTTSTTSAGTYPVTITGTSGSLSSSASVSLIVAGNVATGSDFTVSLAPGQNFPLRAVAGSNWTAQVTVTPVNNYSGTVNATCNASAIAGAQCITTPTNPIAISANAPVPVTVTLNIPHNATPNDPSSPYQVNLTVSDSTEQATLQPPLTVNIAPDFSVNSATASQTVTAGQTSGPYALTVQPVGSSFNGSVSLGCTGLPAGSQCLFNPTGPVTPGNSAVDVVMNISTKANSAQSQKRGSGRLPPPAIWLPVAVMLIGMGTGGAKRTRQLIACFVCCLAIMFFVSCAGVSSGGSGGGQPPPPTTYHVTVTGTSQGTPSDAGQSTTVTLVVN